jgi:hypothetical protein
LVLGYEKLKWARGNPVEGAVPPNIEVPIELATEITKAVANNELPEAFRAVAEKIPLWRAGAVTAERIISPESAAQRKKERTQRILSPYYNEEYFQALLKEDYKKADEVWARAEADGVTISEPAVNAKFAEEEKEEPIDIFEMLGAGRKK